MTSIDHSRILFAGMHDSGKTTFIAALWDYINSDRLDKKLVLKSLANSENQYLEKIRAEWLQCEHVSRTNLNEGETVSMNIDRADNGQNLILEIPDISGELFNTHFQVREWDDEYNDIVKSIHGLLLFINPQDKKNRTIYLADLNEVERELKAEVMAKEDAEEEECNKEEMTKEPILEFAQWSEEYTSNQVKLVEILQFLKDQRSVSLPLQVSVIISRWDVIEKSMSGKPEEWLKEKMPLLYQYLICNQDSFLSKVFGVSAQGGNYKKDKNNLLSLDSHERPKVKMGLEFINDITEPIIWLTQ